MRLVRHFFFFFLLFSAMWYSSYSQTSESKQNPSSSSSTAKKNILRNISDVIPAEAKPDSGLFSIYRVEDKYYMEIPIIELGKEFLLVTRIAKTPQIGHGGEISNTSIVRWERRFDKVYLRTVSYVNIASDTLPIFQSVKSSNFEEIISSLTISGQAKDSSSILVDCTTLFSSDLALLTPQKSLRDQYRISSLSSDRSYIDFIRSYPKNIEIRNVLTYNCDNSPQNPSSRTATFSMHHSMIRLPEKPMQPRLTDWRVGYFSTYKIDYGLDVQRAQRRGYILRWRLEPKDSAAYFRGEIVEPVKPITYYIDPATPLKWRPWLRKGIESWNSAFEKAGFKNAVRVLDPPDSTQDPEFCPEDIRYSVIRYFTSETENAYGPNVHDPRSGEILESDIGWYHNIMNLQTGWYFTQAVADIRSHIIPFPDSLMGELIAYVAAHEFGHTIGFPHNMKASNSYPVDSLRSPTFTKKFGTAPSIMDYARYNYVAQPGDGAQLMPKIGVYDEFALNWGYRLYPGITKPEDETPQLNTLIRLQDNNPMLRYGRQQILVVDPTSQTEDLGDDVIKATIYGLKNLERVSTYIISATTSSDKDYSLLAEMYNKMQRHWSQLLDHVAEHIGGVEGVYKNSGQDGVIYTPVAKEKQKKCVQYVCEVGLSTPKLFLNKEILRRIEPNGSTDKLMRMQEQLLLTMIQNDKLLRLHEYNALDENTYSVVELFTDVERAVFAPTSPDIFQRHIQRAYIQALLLKTLPPPTLAQGSVTTPSLLPSVYRTDIMGIARQQLESLSSRLQSKSTTSTLNAHYKALKAFIRQGLESNKN